MNTALADIWLPDATELRLFAPELALVATIAAVLIVPLVLGRSGRIAAGISLVGIFVVILLTRATAAHVADAPRAGFAPPGAAGMLLCDNLTVFFKLLLMLFAALIIGLWIVGRSCPPAHASADLARAPAVPEFFVLLLTSAMGMSLMVATSNLLVMVIAIEMASVPSYALVAGDKRSPAAAEASLKYVLFGAAASAIMIYGVSLLYGAFGTLDLAIIARQLAADPSRMTPLAWLALLATGVGILFKIAAVPFHFWCPDVFQGAPIEITTWLSVASKAAGLGLLIRIMHTLNASPHLIALIKPLTWGIGAAAAVTCTVGNLAALRQTSVKRMLAYSSIAHAGYMMMAAAILAQPDQPRHLSTGLAALIAYLLVYLVMNFGAFGVAAIVSWRTGSDDLRAFTALGRRAPWLALPMAVCLFSLIGLPPLAGFAAKWWLLAALAKAAALQTWLWALVIVLVVNTVISLYYYVGIIRRMYLTDDPQQPALPAPLAGVLMTNACAILLLLLGTILFNPLGQHAQRHASHLFTPTAILHRPSSP